MGYVRILSTLDVSGEKPHAWRQLPVRTRATLSLRALAAHVRRRWVVWSIALILVVTLNAVAYLRWNYVTESLPHTAYLVLVQDRTPRRGEYYVFDFHGAGPYPAGVHFLKQVIGVPGDFITVKGRHVFVNGLPAGTAKEFARSGFPLQMIQPGEIPPGYYYVYATHPDSFDSRYAQVGLIHESRFLGRAVPLW